MQVLNGDVLTLSIRGPISKRGAVSLTAMIEADDECIKTLE